MDRNWQPKDINEAFFNVDYADLRVNINFAWQKVKDYRAVVNVDEDKVISVVTNNYHLVTNREAYNIADHVVRET